MGLCSLLAAIGVFVSGSPSASLLVTAVQCSEDVCKLKSSQNVRKISQGISVMFSSSFLFQKKGLNFLTFQACFQFHGSVRLGKGDLGGWCYIFARAKDLRYRKLAS